jgi:hypothetical protein
MRRNLAATTSGTGQERDHPVRRGADYDRYYRALDLRPGAPLQEIEDRIQLLRAAFHPDELPHLLKSQAQERFNIIQWAADELRDYWETYAAAPPSADLSGTEGLLDALVEALEGSLIETAGGAAVARETSPARFHAEPAGPRIDRTNRRPDAGRGDDRQRADDPPIAVPERRRAVAVQPYLLARTPAASAGISGRGAGPRLPAPHGELGRAVVRRSEPAAQAVFGPEIFGSGAGPPYDRGPHRLVVRHQLPADPTVQRIEIALEIVQRHVFALPDHLQRMIRLDSPLDIDTANRANVGVVAVDPNPSVPLIAGPSEPRRRRRFSGALLALGIVGLAFALAIWIQVHGLDRDGVGTAPVAPPPQQLGLLATRPAPTGAFALPAARDPYPGINATFVGK